MTIPLMQCPTCEESRNDHPTICTVCGDTLVAPPPPAAAATSRPQRSFVGVRAVPEFLTNDFRQAGRDMRNLLQQMRDVENDAEIWNPNPDVAGRPTAKRILDSIPRIVVDENCSFLRNSILKVWDGERKSILECQAILGEFGPAIAFQSSNANAVVSSPLTGKGGLREKTIKNISANKESESILFMERGDGITFVSKGIMAQKAGATSAVIINNRSDPWPYVMKDSTNEAGQVGLRIPVVMIRQSDGEKILQSNNGRLCCSLHIETSQVDCVVCCETFKKSQTVMKLPTCGHIFHEECALAWLKKQNTCPYCRHELPTDDPEYDAERRRLQRTQPSGTSNAEAEWSRYYG